MVKVVIINKTGVIKESNLKKFTKADLYKKCGFRKDKDFKMRAKWKMNDGHVEIYAKGSGRAGSENKYDLPPPIDSDLFFGNMIAVFYNGDELNEDTIQNLTTDEWEKLYEKLFGGFDDLSNEEEESSEEEIPAEFKTKEGYSKEDGFIVGDDEEEEDDETEDKEDYILEQSTDTSDDDEDEENINELLGSDLDEDDEDEESEAEEEEDDDNDIGSELSEEDYD